jgi:hypothetical protein
MDLPGLSNLVTVGDEELVATSHKEGRHDAGSRLGLVVDHKRIVEYLKTGEAQRHTSTDCKRTKLGFISYTVVRHLRWLRRREKELEKMDEVIDAWQQG